MTWDDALLFGALVAMFVCYQTVARQLRHMRAERDKARRLSEHYFERWGELRDQLALLPYRDPKTGRMQSRSRSHD